MNEKFVNSKTFLSLNIIKSLWNTDHGEQERNHYDLKETEDYCRTIFPKRLAWKWEMANFRQTAKRFSFKNSQLHYKETRILIADKDRQISIIHDTRKESGDTSHSKAMSVHLGRTPDSKKLLHVSFDMGFTTMFHTTYKNVIVVKDTVICHLT